ncbi:MAG: hypothetical protein AAF986_07970 [Pseudomonadota bacterium]
MQLHDLMQLQAIAQERHAGRLAEYQAREEEKSGKGERDDGGGSSMISEEQPAPRPTPPPLTGNAVDRQVKQNRLLKEQFETAQAHQAQQSHQAPHEQAPERSGPTRVLSEPSR